MDEMHIVPLGADGSESDGGAGAGRDSSQTQKQTTKPNPLPEVSHQSAGGAVTASSQGPTGWEGGKASKEGTPGPKDNSS